MLCASAHELSFNYTAPCRHVARSLSAIRSAAHDSTDGRQRSTRFCVGLCSGAPFARRSAGGGGDPGPSQSLRLRWTEHYENGRIARSVSGIR